MKKLFLVLLVISAGAERSSAQCNKLNRDIPVAKFSGLAPSPWSINGQTNDWTTLFGNYTGNPAHPYAGSLHINNFSDQYFMGISNPDNPQPHADLRFLGYTYDSYNVYFYLRRLNKNGSPITYYYFCDVNMDGYMNTGEPVFGGRWGGPSVLDIYRYVPNTSVDYVAGKGNRMYDATSEKVNGYSMKGTVNKLFGSNSIPASSALLPNEVFKAEVTETGYGVEFAIPWRYLKNWVTASAPLVAGNAFSYHVASQYGPVTPSTTYNAANVADNMGSCCEKLAYVQAAKHLVISATSQATGPWSKQFSVTLSNPMNVPEIMGISTVQLTNLQLDPNIPFVMTDIQVIVNGDPFTYDELFMGFIDASGPPYGSTINPGNTSNYIIDLIFPSGGAVLSARATILPQLPTFASIPLYCLPSLIGAGPGDPPIIFDVTTESRNRFIQPGAETSGSKEILKVYPNPGKHAISVQLPSPNGILRIEDMAGKSIRSESVGNTSLIKLKDLQPGFYLVRYTDPSGRSWVTRLLVQ